MQSKFLTNRDWIGWTKILGVFGIVPVLFYWFAIRPPMQEIMGFQRNIPQAMAQGQSSFAGVTRPVIDEQAALAQFQSSFLRRVPTVTDAGDLVRYGAVLSGALAREATGRGMRVLGVEMLNHLVRGQYVPEGSSSSTELAAWPRLSLSQLTDPIRVPMLDLPSLELQMRVQTVSSSGVFLFVESLAHYSVLINVTRIDLEKGHEDMVFRLKMRSYFWMQAYKQVRDLQ